MAASGERAQWIHSVLSKIPCRTSVSGTLSLFLSFHDQWYAKVCFCSVILQFRNWRGQLGAEFKVVYSFPSKTKRDRLIWFNTGPIVVSSDRWKHVFPWTPKRFYIHGRKKRGLIASLPLRQKKTVVATRQLKDNRGITLMSLRPRRNGHGCSVPFPPCRIRWSVRKPAERNQTPYYFPVNSPSIVDAKRSLFQNPTVNMKRWSANLDHLPS